MKEKKQAPSMKRKKSILPVVLILVAAMVLAVLPQIAERGNVEENPSIVAVQAEAAKIETAIRAGGTLTDREAESISLPEDVELNFVVKNGDTVKAGDLIAAVNKKSLMITIAKLQANLESMDEKIEKAMDESTTAKVESPAAGRVKAIYAQNGENITDIMYEHGALAVLSLDGSMALDMTWSDAKVGAAVQVTLSDGEVVSGKVDSLKGGVAVITISDEKAALGEAVSVADSQGNAIGGGELYVHQPLKVTGYYGRVAEINTQVNEKLDAGDTVMKLENAEITAGYAGLLSQRKQMEEQMTTLFNLYHTGGLYARSDGIVAEISDEDNLEAVMAAQASYQLKAMVNSPDGIDGYTNYAACVTEMNGQNLSLALCPVTISDMDYADTQLLDSLPYTQITGYTLPENTMVYVREMDAWALKDLTEIRENDKLILAFADNPQQPVWIVCHHTLQDAPEQTEPSKPAELTVPAAPEDNAEKPDKSESTTPAEPEKPNAEQQKPEDSDTSVNESSPSGDKEGQSGNHAQMQQTPQSSNNAFGGISGSMNAAGTATPEREATTDLILNEVVVCALTPDTDMTVELLIDEMDLAKIQLGQEVSLALDAIPETELHATVTAVADASESESGSAKYAVEITLDRLLQMRSGMNAAVTIPVSSMEAACTVPAAALVEKNGKTMVYTSYDKQTDTLGTPITVTTGVSDGETVEILSGLKAGDTVYYSYTEVIEYEFVQ